MDPYKEVVIVQIAEIKGRVPANLIDLLNVLIHPDVLPLAKAYLQEHDKSDACQKHIAPWNCIEEFEARMQNIDDGWLGGDRGTGMTVKNDMCENCEKQLWSKTLGARSPVDDEAKLALTILRDGDPLLRAWKPRDWGDEDEIDELG